MARSRMRLAAIGLFFSVGPVFFGCGNGYRVDPIYIYSADDERGRTDLDHNLKPINLQEYRFPEVQYRLEQDYHNQSSNPTKIEALARQRYQTGSTEGAPGQSKYPTAYEQAVKDLAARNRLMDILIGRSQRQFEVHTSIIIAGQSTTNLTLDTITMATAGLAAVFTPPVTTTALATTAALTEGFQSAFNERIYLNFLAPRIISEMTQARAAHYALLQQHKLLPVEVYSVDSMLAEIETYHQKGSFLHGIMRLGTESEGALQRFRSTIDLSARTNAEIEDLIKESLRALRPANIETVLVGLETKAATDANANQGRSPGDPLGPLRVEIREVRLLPQTEQSYGTMNADQKAAQRELRRKRIESQVALYLEQQFRLDEVKYVVKLADDPPTTP